MRAMVLLLALAVAGCIDNGTPEGPAPTSSQVESTFFTSGHAVEGTEAPVYQATSLNGAANSLADYQGQVVLVTVWASWCSVCRADEPHWVDLHTEFADSNFTVFAVSREETLAGAQKYSDDNELPYPAFWDSQVNRALGLRNYQPNHVLINQDGIIVSAFEGSTTSRTGGVDGLRADIQRLLA